MKIENLLKLPESKTLEFKENLNSKDKILQTIVAFANTAGGKIVIGISDKEHFIVGVIEPHSIEEKLSNLIADCISPQIVPNIEIILWGNKYLIVIDMYRLYTVKKKKNRWTLFWHKIIG